MPFVTELTSGCSSKKRLCRPAMHPRYAIYYTPPPFSRLAAFASGVIGYDCFVTVWDCLTNFASIEFMRI
jgi:hypothetical protein